MVIATQLPRMTAGYTPAKRATITVDTPASLATLFFPIIVNI